MIQANELRIGNYVSHAHEGILKIASLKHRTTTVFNEEMCFRNFKYSDLVPIRFTPEILEAVGFESTPDSNSPRGTDYTLQINDLMTLSLLWNSQSVGLFIYGDGQTAKSYATSLHQLQNLYFALTNEELEVNFEFARL